MLSWIAFWLNELNLIQFIKEEFQNKNTFLCKEREISSKENGAKIMKIR